jgi:hypothetical protein
MWTLKIHVPGISLQERSIRCDTRSAESFALLRVFLVTLLPQQPPKTALDTKNHEKTLAVPEALFHRESVSFSMHSCRAVC